LLNKGELTFDFRLSLKSALILGIEEIPINKETYILDNIKPWGECNLVTKIMDVTFFSERIKTKSFGRLYGDGVDMEYKKFLSDFIEQATFTGWLSGMQIKELYEDSWLYVSPSIHKGEGAPKTVMEAMLMELQVLVTPKGGTKYFKGANFLSYEPTVEEIKEKASSLSKKRNVKGRQWVLDNHHPKVFVDNVLQAIEEVL